MPLSPEDAEAFRLIEQETLYEALCEQIDAAVLNPPRGWGWGGGAPVNVTGKPADLVDRVVAKYRELGWRVEISHSRNDTKILTFYRS